VAVQALRMALIECQPAPGLIHYSDRGIQYACADYPTLLADHAAQPSMSRMGNPYHNAKAESFIKTLKQEQVHGRDWRDLDAPHPGLQFFSQENLKVSALHSSAQLAFSCLPSIQRNKTINRKSRANPGMPNRSETFPLTKSHVALMNITMYKISTPLRVRRERFGACSAMREEFSDLLLVIKPAPTRPPMK
jgi:hypothetical protein